MRRIILLLVLAFGVGIICTNVFLYLHNPSIGKETSPVGQYSSAEDIPISQKGFEKVDINVDKEGLYLTSGCRQLYFNILESQAYSIATGIGKTIEERPMTHDLMKDVMDSYGIRLLTARIDSYEKDVFRAKLIMIRDNKVIEIDSRPSDAAALAVREEVPLYVSSEIMDSKATVVC